MHKVIFLDRDGTINVDHGYVHEIAKWQFTDRAPQALKKLQDAGYTLAVITNQSGIARKYYSEAAMNTLHDHMLRELAQQGVEIAAIAFCPHDRDSTCDCRKPSPGMARQIEEKIGPIAYGESWTIGDKEADVGFGKNIGTKTALIQSTYWQPEKLTQQPDMIINSLYEFAENVA
jgi:D-glycero-D-manno-heptose 1,7-bisphosphate phosphatase